MLFIASKIASRSEGEDTNEHHKLHCEDVLLVVRIILTIRFALFFSLSSLHV